MTEAEDQRAQLALMPASPPTRGATLSPCGRYRYHLWRSIFHAEPATRGPVLFVMLNPSTADANADDPTIRKCVRFASDLGSRRVEVVNLYALRATDPALLRWCIENEGPSVAVGFDNDVTIGAAALSVVKAGGLVIAAWGAHPIAERRVERVRQIVAMAGAELHCLGTSKNGAPRHPLMLAYSTPLSTFSLGPELRARPGAT